MKQLSINGYLVVEAPDYEYEIILDNQLKEDWYKLDFIRKPGYDGKESIGATLPPGQWKIISTSKDITEEIASKMVFRSKIGNYKDYTHVDKEFDEVGLINALLEMKFSTAIESFRSWQKSNGISNCVILKKI